MSLKISSELRAKLLNAAREAHPLECCGLLMGQNDRVARIVPAANVSDSPHTHFEIDPAVLIAAEKDARARLGAGQGVSILGYYHSHPSGEIMPSQTDAEMAAPDRRYWVVIASSELGVFRAVEAGKIWGRFDLVSILSVLKY